MSDAVKSCYAFQWVLFNWLPYIKNKSMHYSTCLEMNLTSVMTTSSLWEKSELLIFAIVNSPCSFHKDLHPISQELKSSVSWIDLSQPSPLTLSCFLFYICGPLSQLTSVLWYLIWSTVPQTILSWCSVTEAKSFMHNGTSVVQVWHKCNNQVKKILHVSLEHKPLGESPVNCLIERTLKLCQKSVKYQGLKL